MASNEVFLSYASADRERVAPLVHALEAEGVQVWWDRDIAYGDTFHKVIEQALNAAPCVIVAWTDQSVASEWVVNEASDARKRNRLVPVLLDPVTPPLEFRHLQTADLSNWAGDASARQFAGVREAVLAMLARNGPSRPTALAAVVPSRQSRWAIQPMQLLGIGGLLLGVSVLLITLKSLGLIGSASDPADKAGGPVTQSPRPTSSATGASPTEPFNLLDTEGGARLLVATEERWKRLFSGKPTTEWIYRDGFALLAVAGDKLARFDTLAVFVDSTSPYNIKELAIFISTASAEGPFVKGAQVVIPNVRNMEKPLHELRFAPVEARFVKVQVISVREDRPNGILGTIQLYLSAK